MKLYSLKVIFAILFIFFTNSDYATFGKDAGFFCDDESIKMPYHGDSIQAKYLFGVLLGIFGIVVYISELIYKNCQKEHSKPSIKSQCHLHLKYYYTGFIYVLATTEVLKICYTKLRPHFYYTCLPDMSNVDCSKGLITQFQCTGNADQWLVNRDIYKSFPSGHAALSVYAFTFMSVYLYWKKSVAPSTTISVWWHRLIALSSFVWTVTCCVSRIMDNRHFWLDVMTGTFIGLTGGLLTIYIALKKAGEKLTSN